MRRVEGTTGNGVENLTEEFLSPKILIDLADHYSKSSYVLLQAVERIRPCPYASIYFCIGHSLELSFKAYLLSKGVDAEGKIIDRRYLRNLSHDLEECLSRSQGLGLSVDQKLIESISYFNEYFKIQNLRYPVIQIMSPPDVGEFAGEVSEFVSYLKQNELKDYLE